MSNEYRRWNYESFKLKLINLQWKSWSQCTWSAWPSWNCKYPHLKKYNTTIPVWNAGFSPTVWLFWPESEITPTGSGLTEHTPLISRFYVTFKKHLCLPMKKFVVDNSKQLLIRHSFINNCQLSVIYYT